MSATLTRRILRWGILALLVVFVAIQFVPVDRENPPVASAVEAPADVMAVLERACYDCHSHETRWPWYSYVAPVSWWLADHVEHGRDDLNFSEWPVFDFEDREHAFEDIEEQIRKGEMPLESYTWMHSPARLSQADRDLLIEWARSER